MRTVLVVLAVLSLAGCHRSYKDGARAYGKSFKRLGSNIAAVAKKAVPIETNVELDAQVQSDVVALAKHQAQRRVANIEPITIQKSVHRVDRDEPDRARVQAPAQTVEPTITRTTVSTGSDQVWKNLWRDGEKASCEKVDSFDSCKATCADHLRMESMRQLDPKAGKPTNCQCTQGYSKC